MAVNTTVEVVMPAMGDSVSEGTILEWHKQEGDKVSEDETLVEISTDKVDAEVPAPAAGTVVKIHAAEGDTVDVGAVLAEIAADGDGAAPAARREAEAPPSRAGAPAEAASTIDDARDGRVGLRGHDPRVGQAARRRRRGRRDDRRDLHRQGRRRGARARAGTIDRDPRRGRRHRHRRPGHRPHERRRATAPRRRPPRRPRRSRPRRRAPPATEPSQRPTA